MTLTLRGAHWPRVKGGGEVERDGRRWPVHAHGVKRAGVSPTHSPNDDRFGNG